jgi:F0F1-type ATP synthase assembly protein I
MFAKRWMKESGVTEESAKNANMVKLFGLAFLLSLIASFFLAMFIGADAGAGFGALAGFMAGLGWVFTFMGIIYLFEQKTMAHFLINSLYSVASLTIMGFVIGIWQ